jgi:hypothetical protein
METAKEKAKQLYNKFYEASDGIGISKYQSKVELAKKSAIIAVDEIIEASPALPILGDGGYFSEDIELSTAYWQEVKNELNQL